MMSTVPTSLVDDWGARLTQHGHHVTAPRLSVIELFAQCQRVVTAAQIFELAVHQDMYLGRATVYRTLELLEKLHLIFRVSYGGRQHAYVRADLTMQPLAICEECGDLQVVQSRLFELLLAELYQESDFAVHSHSLQIFGLCQSCRS